MSRLLNYLADIKLKEIKDNEEIFTAIASTPLKDRHGETINPKGWRFENYLKNPVILFAHKYDELPVGKTLKIYQNEKNETLIDFVLAKGIDIAENLRKLIKQGIQKGLSVGFMPIKVKQSDEDPYDIMEQELYEISLVPIPANPDALVQLGYKPEEIKNLVEIYKKDLEKIKADEEKWVVCGDRNLPIDDESDWDGEKARDEMDKYSNGDMEKYKKGFVLRDDNKKENKTAYKLPFVRVKGGKIVATWGGVSNAMKAVLGARTEMKVPDEVKKRAYDFLSVYYKKFDREVPEFKSYSEEELNKILEKSYKEFKKRLLLKQILFHVKQASKNSNIALMKYKILRNLYTELKVKNSK